jgi:hypothetical protein
VLPCESLVPECGPADDAIRTSVVTCCESRVSLVRLNGHRSSPGDLPDRTRRRIELPIEWFPKDEREWTRELKPDLRQRFAAAPIELVLVSHGAVLLAGCAELARLWSSTWITRRWFAMALRWSRRYRSATSLLVYSLKGGSTMIRKHFRLRRVALGLAFAAVAAPAAHATPVLLSGGVTPTLSQLQAEASRVYGSQGNVSTRSIHGGVTPTLSQLQAEASRVYGSQGNVSTRSIHGGVTPTLAQLQAEASRVYGSQGNVSTRSIHGGATPTLAQLEQQAAQYRARLDATNAQVTAAGSDDLEWTDAGIGASVTLGSALLLLTCFGLGRRYRSRSQSTGLAST